MSEYRSLKGRVLELKGHSRWEIGKNERSTGLKKGGIITSGRYWNATQFSHKIVRAKTWWVTISWSFSRSIRKYPNGKCEGH